MPSTDSISAQQSLPDNWRASANSIEESVIVVVVHHRQRPTPHRALPNRPAAATRLIPATAIALVRFRIPLSTIRVATVLLRVIPATFRRALVPRPRLVKDTAALRAFLPIMLVVVCLRAPSYTPATTKLQHWRRRAARRASCRCTRLQGRVRRCPRYHYRTATRPPGSRAPAAPASAPAP